MTARPLPGNRWDLLDGVVPDEPPRVTVVVAHYDDPHGLALVLAGLAAQTHPADRLQVVVADDGSPSPPAVPAGVAVVRQDDCGFRAAAARNLGAAAADGDVICFLDGDTVPEPSYVEHAVRLPALCPDAVVVGRRRHADLSGLTPEGLAGFVARPRAVLTEPAWLVDAYRRSRDLLDADVRSYRFVISAVLTMARSLFDELGGFDGGFVGYGGEDWELAHRAWCAGAVLAHEPRAVAWHDGPEWGERALADPEAARRTKTAETLALAGRVPDPLLRGAGPWPPAVEVVVRYAVSGDEVADVTAVRTLLASYPDVVVHLSAAVAALGSDSRVVVGPPAAWVLARAVVVVDVEGPAAVDLRVVRAALVGEVGRVTGAGVEAVTTRALHRARRHGCSITDLFDKATVETVSAAAPDLARQLPRPG